MATIATALATEAIGPALGWPSSRVDEATPRTKTTPRIAIHTKVPSIGQRYRSRAESLNAQRPCRCDFASICGLIYGEGKEPRHQPLEDIGELIGR